MPRRHADGSVVVIGAGIGGLLVAAGLCRDGVAANGRDVVVLERLPFAGGRFTSLNRAGYQLSTGAVHTLPFGTRGPMARLLGRLVPSIEIRDADGLPSFHVDGREVRWERRRDLFRLFSPGENLRLVTTALGMGWSKGMRGDGSFGEWLRRNAPTGHTTHPTDGNRVYRLLERAMHFGLSAGPDDVPSHEVQRLFRNWRDKRRSGVLIGGCGGVIDALLQVIEQGGGVVRTRSEVTRVLVRGGAVCGVCVRATKGGETFVLETDTVISDIGPKATVALLDGGVADGVAQRVAHQQEARGLKFQLASDEPLLSHAGVMFCLDTERVAGVVQPSNADAGLAPPGKHLVISHQVMQSDDFAHERALGLADLRALFGNRFKVLSAAAYRGRWPVNRMVQGHDVRQLPIHGLYLVGDGCKAPGYLMVEGIARHVECVLDEIH